jgi:aflatoxin B1 aldehyde reductase
MASRRDITIALGTMTFGGQTNAKDAERMVDQFLDAGHSWVDTANIYTEGRSEKILGRILRGKRREKTFLATKVYPNNMKGSTRFGLRPKRVRESLETSLKRLKMDHVDLLYLHAPDNATPLVDTLGVVNELMTEGKVLELGLSNYAAWQVSEVASLCETHGWASPIIYQGMYNAITRVIADECIPACRHFGIDFIAYNPLAGGLLTGKHIATSATPASGRFSSEYYRNRFWKPEYFEAVTLIAAVAKKSRIHMADAALRWLVHHSETNGILIGASSLAHFEQNLTACDKRPLPPKLVKAIDKAWDIAKPVCQRYFRD